MTREVAIKAIQDFIGWFKEDSLIRKALEMAIKALENHDTFMKYAYSQGKHDALSQEPTTTTNNNEPITIIYPTIVCDDAVSREAVINLFNGNIGSEAALILHKVKQLPSVTQKSGKCKDCKYFEYDSVANVYGVPLIVAHEICNKWGDGCKTSEDGYCYLFEPKESEEQTE